MTRSERTPGERRSRSLSILLWLPWLALVLGLAASFLLWRHARSEAHRRLETDFRMQTDKLLNVLQHRLDGQVQVLRGVAGLFEASREVSRQEFRAYVAALRLEQLLPGVQGVGFAESIAPERKLGHIRAIRAEGFPEYAILPEGERELYTSIAYLEPFDERNRRAFGYDMLSEPVRRTAMERARDEDRPAMSGKVKLVQETEIDVQAGFLIYVPVYRAGARPGDIAGRRAASLGWAYSPVRARNMLSSLLADTDLLTPRENFDLEIFDGERLEADALLFDSDNVPRFAQAERANTLRALGRIEFAGRVWSIALWPTRDLDAWPHSEKSRWIAYIGGAGSLLLSGLAWLLAADRMRDAAVARERERNHRELAASEENLRHQANFARRILDSTDAHIAVVDSDGIIMEVNEAWRRFARENGGKERWGKGCRYFRDNPDRLSDAECARAAYAGIRQVQRGESTGFELEYPCHDGNRRRWFMMRVRPLAGRPGAVLISHTAITDRKLAEEALRASLAEKTVLLKEVHHRVKNNLQVISSILNLQVARVRAPEIRQVLNDTQNRVRSMALLHETLYRSDNLAYIRLPEYVETLCVQLLRAAGPEIARVRMERAIDDIALPLEQATPCGLIVNELVSNALKHAFPNGRNGLIAVSAKILDDARMELAVADDGMGLPENFDPRACETLGLQLVNMLAAQLRGELIVVRAQGAEFRVLFPLSPNRT